MHRAGAHSVGRALVWRSNGCWFEYIHWWSLWLHFFGFPGRKPLVVYNRRGTRLILSWAAHLIEALPGYAHLTEFQPRHGSCDPCFASSKYSCTVFARLQWLTTHSLSCDRRKPRRRRGSDVRRFGAKETQRLCCVLEQDKY